MISSWENSWGKFKPKKFIALTEYSGVQLQAKFPIWSLRRNHRKLSGFFQQVVAFRTSDLAHRRALQSSGESCSQGSGPLGQPCSHACLHSYPRPLRWHLLIRGHGGDTSPLGLGSFPLLTLSPSLSPPLAHGSIKIQEAFVRDSRMNWFPNPHVHCLHLTLAQFSFIGGQ